MAKKIIDDNFIARLEALALSMPSNMGGYFGGNHKTKTYGSTVEFADFREYMLGDDIRSIDWNLYSRFEKHYIKLFVDERRMHIQTFLDCSASMKEVDDEKAAYAMRIVATLGFLAVQGMDKASFKLIKGENPEDLCGTIVGKDAFFNAMNRFENTEFSGTADIEKAVINCPNPGLNDGMTVIVSDFLSENNWKTAVDYLLFKRRHVMLIQVLTPDEINPVYNGRMMLMDAEATSPMDERNMKLRITRSVFETYKLALKDYLQDMKDFCASRGAILIQARTDEPVEKLVFRKLYETGVMK